MATLKTRTIKAVELLATGSWHGSNCPEDGCKFEEQDLDELVDSYQKLQGKFDAPVKLGHDEQQKILQSDGYPAAGWVTNLRRVGNKLLGDLEKVPAAIADLIDAGAYRKRSSEVRPNAEIDGTKYPLVFSGLALLGSDLPAVEGLSDITKLYASLNLEKEEDANAFLFESESDPVEDVITELESVVTRAENIIRGRKGAPKLRTLVQAAKEELRRVATTKGDRKMALDEQAVRALLGIGPDDDVWQALESLKQKAAAAGEGGEGEGEGEGMSEDSELRKELSSAQAKIMELEKANAMTEASAQVDSAIKDGKLLPAQRDFAIKFALSDAEGFKQFVENQPSVLEFGERGTANSGGASGAIDMSKFEPTQSEIDSAKQLGIWSDEYRVNLMRTKAETQGYTVPADFGKPANANA